MRTRVAVGIVVMILMVLASMARGQSQENPDDTKTTIEALKQRLRDQDRRLSELEAKQATSAATTQAAAQRDEIKKLIQEMNADAAQRSPMPGWLDNLKFAGDLRLRLETQSFNWGPTASDDDKKERNRARFRLRFGFVKTWLDDQLETGFRLASGSDNSPTSENQTLDGNYSKKDVWIDLAYAKYTPKDFKGFMITGGKMKTPWNTNELFFDSDINPEGIWAEYTLNNKSPVQPFIGAGFFSLKESADVDTTAAIYQAGIKAELAKNVKYTVAGVYQAYDNYATSGATPNGNDSPLSRVPEFRVIGLNNSMDFMALGRPLSLFADVAHNCGADDTTTKYEGQDNALATGVKYGQNKKKGDWSVKYRYAYIEANSMPGYFVDSDFGFANRKGHVIGGEYNLLDSLTFGVSVYLTEPVFSPTTTTASSAFEDMTTTVMADLVWKF